MNTRGGVARKRRRVTDVNNLTLGRVLFRVTVGSKQITKNLWVRLRESFVDRDLCHRYPAHFHLKAPARSSALEHAPGTRPVAPRHHQDEEIREGSRE